MKILLILVMVIFPMIATLIWMHEGRVQLHTKKGLLAALLLLLGAIASVTQLLTSAKPSVEAKASSQGGVVVQATAAGFERDLKNEIFEGDLQKGEKESSEESKDYFYAGERAFKANKYQDAIRNYQNSIEARPTPSAYMNLGLCFWNILDLKNAEDSFQQGLRLVQKRKDDIFQLFFLANIGKLNINMGNLEKALNYFESIIPYLYIDLFNIIYTEGTSRINLIKGKVELALQGYKENLRIATLMKDSEITQVYAMIAISDIYVTQYRDADALDILHKAEKLAAGRNVPSLLSSINVVKARVYSQQNKLAQSLFFFQEAINLSKESGDIVDYINALMNIGIFYLVQDKPDQALTYFKEMDSLIKGKEFLEVKVRSLIGMCLSYALQKQLDEVIDKCEEALNLAQEGEFFVMKVFSMLTMSYAYAMQGRSEALKFFRDGWELAQQSDNLSTKYFSLLANRIIFLEIMNKFGSAFIDISAPFMEIAAVKDIIEWFGTVINKTWQIIKASI
jgi:tetratricopeptide (TPR) repeat protein